MKVIDKRIQCLKGERFSQIMSGFDFDSAEQITALLFLQESAAGTAVSKSFVKKADTKFPTAKLITKNSDGKMTFLIDTESMEIGDYDLEVRVDLSGVSSPIVKESSFFLTVKESRT